MTGSLARLSGLPSQGRMRDFGTVVVSVLCMAGSLVGVLAAATPAGADTASFSSAQIGTTGSTASFNQSGPWLMSWAYNCSNIGIPGTFFVNVNQHSANLTLDIGPVELGSSGSGTDHYYDTGSFNLDITSDCNWIIVVTPDSGAASRTPITLTSAQVGTSGNTVAFFVASPWTMAWTYDCASFGSSGPFIVYVNQPLGGLSDDFGPDELGTGGSGSNSYTDEGTFSLSIISGCDWSITITPSVVVPPPVPPAPVYAPVAAARPFMGIAATPDGNGYWLVDSAGDVVPEGDAVAYGSMTGHHLNAPIYHIVSTPDGGGYWMVAADGGIFAFGDAQFYGSMGGQHLNAPVVGLAPTPDGKGYWLVASDGGIFTFGDAVFYGSMGGQHLNKPVVGMAADPATGGYWEVATDGGIFSFHAPFFGSTGNIHLNKPINHMAATPDGKGYRFVASDGGVFDEGDAQFYGSTGGMALTAPIVGIATDPATGGYWLVGSDGGVFSFNAPFEGSAASP